MLAAARHAMVPASTPQSEQELAEKFRVMLVGSPYQDERYRRIAEGLVGCDIIRYADQAEFAADPVVRQSDVILLDRFFKATRDIMAGSPRLRAVISPLAGIDQIDIAAATELGIIVGRGQTPENSIGMAEATVLLMLASLYELNKVEAVLRSNVARPTWPPGRLMHGKIIGLVGYGKIARGVCDRLSGWGVTIKVYSRRPVEHPSPDVREASLEELLRTSDIVSIHAGLDKDTRGLMNEERLRMMKKGAIFINTARGAIVDEQALARVAQDGIIARIALDAYVVDPLPSDSPLRSLPNAILTPNMIGHTQEGALNFIATAIESVQRVLRLEPPVHVCNEAVIPRWQERWAGAAVLERF